ncbi:MAG: ribonuclease HI family protein [Coriobacteriales bacterium]|jgi:ribonuclease HI|nr:ribonuclease HI family protein [Coriobacteriales bacterium]
MQSAQDKTGLQAILHTDGGSRGNPGPAGIGFVLEEARLERRELPAGTDGFSCATVKEELTATGRVLASGGAYTGEGTNNQAEYQALIWGMQNAHATGVKQLKVVADSELMVKQMQGLYKVKNPGIKMLFAQADALRKDFDEWSIEHTLRGGNKAADALVNLALDTRSSCGDFKVAWQSTGPSLF